MISFKTGQVAFSHSAAELPPLANLLYLLANASFCEAYIQVNIREVIGTSPRRTVFDIIIAGHMFRDYRDAVGGNLRQQIGGGKARNTSAVNCLSVSFPANVKIQG